MKLFLDTANIDEIREVMEWGVIDGVTTNPKIVSKEKGVDFEERMREIFSIVKGDVSVEVTSNDLDEMVSQALAFASWGDDNVVVKIPMCETGLRAVTTLRKYRIKTNVTAIMSVPQAILAAKCGATYASIFLGRIGDIGADEIGTLRDAVRIYDTQGFATQIIVGSIRHMAHITDAAKAGAHVITVPYKFMKQMAFHPQTEKTIREFLDSWADFETSGTIVNLKAVNER